MFVFYFKIFTITPPPCYAYAWPRCSIFVTSPLFRTVDQHVVIIIINTVPEEECEQPNRLLEWLSTYLSWQIRIIQRQSSVTWLTNVTLKSIRLLVVIRVHENCTPKCHDFCAKRLLRSSGPPGASVRRRAPPCAVRRRPAKSANVQKMDRLKRI